VEVCNTAHAGGKGFLSGKNVAKTGQQK